MGKSSWGSLWVESGLAKEAGERCQCTDCTIWRGVDSRPVEHRCCHVWQWGVMWACAWEQSAGPFQFLFLSGGLGGGVSAERARAIPSACERRRALESDGSVHGSVRGVFAACSICRCYEEVEGVRSRHFMARHVTSRYVMSCHVMSCHVMSCHVMSCHVMSGRVTSSHAMSFHAVSLLVKSSQVDHFSCVITCRTSRHGMSAFSRPF